MIQNSKSFLAWGYKDVTDPHTNTTARSEKPTTKTPLLHVAVPKAEYNSRDGDYEIAAWAIPLVHLDFLLVFIKHMGAKDGLK
jgi:hypothetical protein